MMLEDPASMRRSRALAVFVVLASVGTSPAGAAPFIGAPHVVARDSPLVAARVVLDSHGNAYAASAVGLSSIVIARRPTRGTWKTDGVISAANPRNIRLSLDRAGLLSVFWTQANRSTTIATATRSRKGIWAAPVVLLRGALSEVSFASNGDGIVVGQSRNPSATIVSRAKIDGAWRPPRVIQTPSQVDISEQDVAIDANGRATTTWLPDVSGPNKGMCLSSSTSENGGAWTTPANIACTSTGAYGQSRISNAHLGSSDSGLATVIYSTVTSTGSTATDTSSISATQKAPGDAWSPPQVIAQGNTAHGPVEDSLLAVSPRGAALLLWPSSPDVVSASMRSVSRGWSPVPPITSLHAPKAAAIADTGLAVVVGDQQSGFGYEAALTMSQLGSQWHSPVTLGGPTGDESSNQPPEAVAINPTGTFVASWSLANNRVDVAFGSAQ